MKILSGAIVLMFAFPVLATTLNAGVQGTVEIEAPIYHLGGQATVAGTFTSYTASPDLPQINAGDLAAYSFVLNGTFAGISCCTDSAVFAVTSGSIDAYGQTIQQFQPTNLYVNAGQFLQASLASTGSLTPPGYPGPIDFTPANGAEFFADLGPLMSNGVEAFSGSITFSDVPPPPPVPEPATIGVLGFVVAGLAAARKRARPKA